MMKRLTAILLVMVLVLSCIGIGEAASAKRLKKGSRGAAVKTLQTALKEQGYYSGKIDGIFGKGTVNAVKAHRKSSIPAAVRRLPLRNLPRNRRRMNRPRRKHRPVRSHPFRVKRSLFCRESKRTAVLCAEHWCFPKTERPF